MQLEGKIVNFLGDSITAGTGTSSRDAIYHALLARNAKLKEARNYGVSGMRIAVEADEYIDPDFNGIDKKSLCVKFEQMDDADAVVVFCGTNDYGHGDIPIGGFTDRTIHSFYGACHYLFRGLIKKYLGKPIAVVTPLHRTYELGSPPGTVHKRGGLLKEYVDAIREVAEFYSLPVLDLYATSGIQPDVPEIMERYIPDGLHPNDEGHVIIAAKLKTFLEQL